MRFDYAVICTRLSVITALIFLAPAPCRSAGVRTWEVRRALAPDQTSEWSAAGYLPGWRVTPDASGDAVRIDGDAAGRFRGAVLVGTRVTIPNPLPRSAHLHLEFKSFCALNNLPRSGVPAVGIFTLEQWQQFETSTSPSRKLLLRGPSEDALYYETIPTNGADVINWRAWDSAELAPWLRPAAGKEVVIAFVWMGLHYTAEEWAEMRKLTLETQSEEDLLSEFYASLDGANPDLKPVIAAAQHKDWSTAARLLAEHFRRRQAPPPPALTHATSTAAADRIVAHEFRLVGCKPYRYPGEIKWNADPFDYEQWAIALNRHFHWLTLGEAYAGTKDEKYAREFVDELRSWVQAMPCFIGRHWVEGPYDWPDKSPLTLDAGIRMGQTWIPAFYYFLPSPAFTDADVVLMLRSFREHALYLMNPTHFHAGSNWGAMEANGLLHIGIMFPEFKDAGTWRDTAIQRLHDDLTDQVYPDGAQMELTPGYHGVTLGNFLMAIDICQRCKVALPPDFVAGIERMFAYYVHIATPSRLTPPLNDSGREAIRGWMQRALQFFPNRQDFRYFATDGKEGAPPAYTSCRMDYAGWHIMRSGWDPDACYLLLDGGPFGAGHQHEDKLSIIIDAFGRSLLTEPGTYSYDASAWRQYVLSTRGHNTVIVDGLDQRSRAHPESFRTTKPVDTDWITNAVFDYARASYDYGYGMTENVPVRHQREVLFIKPRTWLVVDRLTPGDNKAHRYDSLFHLDAPAAVVDAKTGMVVTRHESGPEIAIIPVADDGWKVAIVQGQTEPVVQGWLPTGQHGVLRPIPTAIYSHSGTGATSIAYLLVPLRQGDLPPQVETLPLTSGDGFAVCVTGADHHSFTILWNRHPGSTLATASATTSAHIALLGGDATVAGSVP